MERYLGLLSSLGPTIEIKSFDERRSKLIAGKVYINVKVNRDACDNCLAMWDGEGFTPLIQNEAIAYKNGNCYFLTHNKAPCNQPDFTNRIGYILFDEGQEITGIVKVIGEL